MTDVAQRVGEPDAVQYINPPTMMASQAFSQVVVVSGSAKMVYIGGQNTVDASGALVGEGDIAAQADQVFVNLQAALAAGGASLEHVIRWTIYIVQGQPLAPGFAAFRRVWGDRPNPPTIVAIFVAGLGNPAYLLELDAIAAVPQ